MSIPIPVNPSEVSRSTPKLPATSYRVRIAGEGDAGHRPIVRTSKAGNPYLRLRFEIVSTADGREVVIDSRLGEEMSCVGKALFDNISLNEKEFNVRKLRCFLEAFGIDPNLPDGLPDDGDGATISEWVGLEGVVNTKVGDSGYLEVDPFDGYQIADSAAA